MTAAERFAFEFEPRFRPVLALAGVTPRTAHVTVTPERLVARFGPWTCETVLANVRDTCITGPYQWYKAIGIRASFVDRGLTFGSTTRGGVCVLFHDAVTGIDPFGAMLHPGLTVTVADPERLVTTLRNVAGID